MADAELAVTIVLCAIVMLLIIVVAVLAGILAVRVHRTNAMIVQWANTCLEKTMAWSDVQREHMRMNLEENRSELLLREARDRAGFRPERAQQDDDGMDIRVPTGSGIVTD